VERAARAARPWAEKEAGVLLLAERAGEGAGLQ
jgi:hypothetical protein